MEQHIVKIISIQDVTHDVKSFRVQKPAGYTFTPGQATEVSVNKPGWENERRPFTFTSLERDSWLEFTIKRYTGVTHQLHELKPGDEIILHDVWGAISYKGPGYFIAGGAGITPFIAILRDLYATNRIDDNVLLFSNKTSRDIIYENELVRMMGKNAKFILSRERNDAYEHGLINSEFLKSKIADLRKHFYVCGPDKMVQDVSSSLAALGIQAESIVFEK
jgi:ferredoxin-NADP reductase